MIRGIRYLHTDDLPDVTRFCWSDCTQSYRPISIFQKMEDWGPAPFPIGSRLEDSFGLPPWSPGGHWIDFRHQKTSHGPGPRSKHRIFVPVLRRNHCGNGLRPLRSSVHRKCGWCFLVTFRAKWGMQPTNLWKILLCVLMVLEVISPTSYDLFFSEKCGVEPLQWRFYLMFKMTMKLCSEKPRQFDP